MLEQAEAAAKVSAAAKSPSKRLVTRPASANTVVPERRITSQTLKENMGEGGLGVQRIGSQGQDVGWAPADVVYEVAQIFDHGSQLTERGQFAEAEPILREALMYFEELVGEGHTYSLLCANQLCFTLHQLGKFAEGEHLGKKSSDGFRKTLGAKHEHTVAAMNNYASCCRNSGNMSAAVETLREALAISEEANGLKHHATMAILSNLADTVRQDGDHASAEGMFRKCYAFEAETQGADSLGCSQFANNLAVALRDQGKNKEARYWYERALGGMTKYFGHSHEKVKLVAQNLKELEDNPDAHLLELPKFLMIERGKSEQRCHRPDEQFLNKPMCGFPDQAVKSFSRTLQPIQAALRMVT
jgi:tetratricopeptide (TPR) repeat protein